MISVDRVETHPGEFILRRRRGIERAFQNEPKRHSAIDRGTANLRSLHLDDTHNLCSISFQPIDLGGAVRPARRPLNFVFIEAKRYLRFQSLELSRQLMPIVGASQAKAGHMSRHFMTELIHQMKNHAGARLALSPYSGASSNRKQNSTHHTNSPV